VLPWGPWKRFCCIHDATTSHFCQSSLHGLQELQPHSKQERSQWIHLKDRQDDKQLTASLDLYGLAERILDSKEVLGDIHSNLQDGEATKRSKETSLLALRKTVIPLLQFASDTIRSSTKLVVAPIAGSQYVHIRNEAEKRASAATVTPTSNETWGQTLPRKSEPLRRIENTLATENDEIKKRKATSHRLHNRHINNQSVTQHLIDQGKLFQRRFHEALR
jgi:hypothetical protein